MTDANGQPMTQLVGWGRGGATAAVFHASGSWWYLFAVMQPQRTPYGLTWPACC
jgi:hypothetical protein